MTPSGSRTSQVGGAPSERNLVHESAEDQEQPRKITDTRADEGSEQQQSAERRVRSRTKRLPIRAEPDL